MRVHLFVCILPALFLCTGCGLFGDLPAFQGSDTGLSEDAVGEECRQASDCSPPENMEASCTQNQCIFECEAGFVDREEPLGCECEINEEICDGRDNDCDGSVDNLFGGGQIDVGRTHTCATTAAGEIYCWGNNSAGQLGLGTTVLQSSPKRLPASDDIAARELSLGAEHTCVIDDSSDHVYCWGANAHGQLGDDDETDRLVPTPLADADEYNAVSAGTTHTCAIKVDNRVFCWGDNAAGQLGTGDTVASSSPVESGADSTFVAVDAGVNHTCALQGSSGAQGLAYCWGANDAGQLGTGNSDDQLEPSRVESNETFAGVSAGGNVSCARTSSDDVYCWGADELSPTRLVGIDDSEAEFRVVSAGASDTICGVLAGAVHCGNADEWREINDFDFVDVATAHDHTCAINKNGRIYCWGANAYGQIGIGSTGGTVTHPAGVACN